MPVKTERPIKPAATVAPMTALQATRLKQLACDAYELEAFKTHLTQVEAQRRIAVLTAKLAMLDEPPHTL